MTDQDKKMAIGSLSNDIYRVATLAQRGSLPAAQRFFVESKRWTTELQQCNLKMHIRKIIQDVESVKIADLPTPETTEKFLMYSVLLQNYGMHL